MANSQTPAELKNCKCKNSISPIWACSSISRKWQAMGLESSRTKR